MVGRSLARQVATACVVTLGTLAACSQGTPSGSGGGAVVTPQSPVSPTQADPTTVEGTFDVGGHKLFISCEGTGSPTVVYLHGSITEAAAVPHANGERFRALLRDDHRVCLYDRRNVGDSDYVDAPQLPADALRDMRRLLAAARIDPPYVLVGASFGGMLAYLYANQHPDEVVGMVLLDAMFPDELSLEHLFEPSDRYQAYDEVDEADSLERISHFKVQRAAQRYIGHEPRIPVVYLASDSEGYEDNDYGVPEYTRRIVELQAGYVDRFSPGTLIKVDAPHFMEPVVPDQIAESVRDVVAQAGG